MFTTVEEIEKYYNGSVVIENEYKNEYDDRIVDIFNSNIFESSDDVINYMTCSYYHELKNYDNMKNIT